MISDYQIIQDSIHGLLRIKKSFTGPQGCSVKQQQINNNKARDLTNAMLLLKEFQKLIDKEGE